MLAPFRQEFHIYLQENLAQRKEENGIEVTTGNLHFVADLFRLWP